MFRPGSIAYRISGRIPEAASAGHQRSRAGIDCCDDRGQACRQAAAASEPFRGKEPLGGGRPWPASPMKWEISVNGRVLDLDSAQSTTAECIEPGVYSVLQGGRSFEVRIAPASDSWIVQIGGKQFSVEVQDPREAGGHSRGALGHGRQ